MIVDLWKPRDVPAMARAGFAAEQVLGAIAGRALASWRHRDRLLDVVLRHSSPAAGPGAGTIRARVRRPSVHARDRGDLR